MESAQIEDRISLLEQQIAELVMEREMREGEKRSDADDVVDDVAPAPLQVYYDEVDKKWYLKYYSGDITYDGGYGTVSPSADNKNRIELDWIEHGEGSVWLTLELVTDATDHRIKYVQRIRFSNGEAESSSSSSSSSSGGDGKEEIDIFVASVSGYVVTQHLLGGLHLRGEMNRVLTCGSDSNITFTYGSTGNVAVNVYYK